MRIIASVGLVYSIYFNLFGQFVFFFFFFSFFQQSARKSHFTARNADV